MIKPATMADATAIAHLHCACFERGWKEQEILDLFASGGIHAWVTEKDEGVIAFLMTRVAADECEILSLAVDRFFRRQALALKLMLQLHETALKAHWHKIFLEVAEDNIDAYALYEKLGYTVFHRRKAYYQRWHGRKIDALLMEKKG